MRKLLATATAIALVGAGVLASTVVGQDSGDIAPLTDRPVVQGEVERVSAAHARAAGAAVQRPKKNKKGPKVSYYIQTAPVDVAPETGAELVGLTCPGKKKVVAGYFQTSGGVTTDYFSRSDADLKSWLFGFVNVSTVPAQAVGAIVCMTKV